MRRTRSRRNITIMPDNNVGWYGTMTRMPMNIRKSIASIIERKMRIGRNLCTNINY
jgi:cobalamin synthase